VNDRLPTGFDNGGAGALCEENPNCRFEELPKRERRTRVILRAEDVNVIGAVSADANVIVVCGAKRGTAIVGFEKLRNARPRSQD